MQLAKSKRKRGVRLSNIGLQKWQQARRHAELEHNYGEKFTLEDIAHRSDLTPMTIAKVLDGKQGVDRRTIEALFAAFALSLGDADYISAQILEGTAGKALESMPVDQNWTQAVDIGQFYGRIQELAQLEKWILEDNCRMVGLLGMGGIGKTTLSLRLAKLLEDHFQTVLWYSLANTPQVEELITQLLDSLGVQKQPTSLESKVACLLEHLQDYRCLLVLDNCESLLRGGDGVGPYCEGLEAYSLLFKSLGSEAHQSCVVLTSREKLQELVWLEGCVRSVRSMKLSGLSTEAAQQILQAQGILPSPAGAVLVEHYGGNPLALQIVITSIQELFGGSVEHFLAEQTTAFGDIALLIDQHFERLSQLQKEVLYWLAIEREAILFGQLREDCLPTTASAKLIEALEALVRRSLVEKGAGRFTLQPVIMEYVTNKLIEGICAEVARGEFQLLWRHALIKAWGKDYLRQSQTQLILEPILSRLLAASQDPKQLEAQFMRALGTRRLPQLGYLAGNVLNLLVRLGTDLRGWDFSGLAIWQADLRTVNLQCTNFSQCNFSRCAFAEDFCGLLSVAFSHDGQLIATGGDKGEISLLSPEGQPLFTLKGHRSWVTALRFLEGGTQLASSSNDGTIKVWDLALKTCLRTLVGHTKGIWSLACFDQTIISGGEDGYLRLWDAQSGQCLKTFKGHVGWIRAVAFAPDGRTIASGGEDRTLRIWNVATGQARTLTIHEDWITCIAFRSDGQMLAMGGEDGTIRLFHPASGKSLGLMVGHNNRVCTIAFSADGSLLVTGSEDQSIKLWDIQHRQCARTLLGHSRQVWCVALNGNILASCSEDQSLRLWELPEGKCLQTIQGYTNRVKSVAFSPDGVLLASSSENQSPMLWDVATGKVVLTLNGHTQWVQSIIFSPDGRQLATASDDRTVRLWDASSGRCSQILRGHTSWVWNIAFSPDGRTLASSSHDGSVRLWDVASGQVLLQLNEHQWGVWSVCFSPDGSLLASSSQDQTIKLWDPNSGQCLKTLRGHETDIWSVAFHPDGEILASVSEDRTVRIWDVLSGECLRILVGHASWIWSVAFSPDGSILASASEDRTVRIWDSQTGECLQTLTDHRWLVMSVAFRKDGELIATASQDEIKLWDPRTGKVVRTLQFERLYEGMNIAEATGLSSTQQIALQALGAVEAIH